MSDMLRRIRSINQMTDPSERKKSKGTLQKFGKIIVFFSHSTGRRNENSQITGGMYVLKFRLFGL